MRSKYLTTNILIVLLCVLGATLSIYKFIESFNITLSRQNEEPVATVLFKYKSAQRKFRDRELWDRLHKESPLYNGDTIRTAEDSEATIAFKDGNIVDMQENSMIQILFLKGEAVVEVNDGGFTVNTKKSESGLKIKVGDNTLSLDKDSQISGTAVKSSEKTNFQVIAGSVGIISKDSSEIKVIGEGKSVLISEKAEEKIVELPVVSVISPVPNAKILDVSELDMVPVNFKWRSEHFSDDEVSVLEISTYRDFSLLLDQRELSPKGKLVVPLAAGSYYWRMYPKTAGAKDSQGGKFKVISAKKPELVSPAVDSQFSFRTKMPSVRFAWTDNEWATAYTLELSRTDSFKEIDFSVQVPGTSCVVPSVAEGTWFWRVRPFYALNDIGFAPPSDVHSFIVSKFGELPSPVLLQPASGTALDKNFKKSLSFSWKADSEAKSYAITIAKDSNFENVVLAEETSANFYQLDIASRQLVNGVYYWRVTESDDEGNVSPVSETRTFLLSEIELEQNLVSPADGYSILDSKLQDVRFSWKMNFEAAETRFQVSDTSDFTTLIVDDVVRTESKTLGTLPTGSYFWRVRSETEARSFVTEPRAFSVIAQFSAPRIFSPLDSKLVITDSTPVKFEWESLSGADIYHVRVSRDDGTTNSVFDIDTSNNFILSDLSEWNSGNYSFCVYASAAETPISMRRPGMMSEKTFSVRQLRHINLHSPDVIDGVSAIVEPQKVSWTAEEKIVGSQFTLSKESDGVSNPIVTVQNPPSSVQLPVLEPGTYYWTVSGKTEDGYDVTPKKASSFKVSAITPLARPVAVSPASGTEFGPSYLKKSTKVRISWEKVPDATEYLFILQSADGKSLVRETLKKTEFTINLANYDVSKFTWMVKPSQYLKNGTFVRTGSALTASFSVFVPETPAVEFNDTGDLYGN